MPLRVPTLAHSLCYNPYFEYRGGAYFCLRRVLTHRSLPQRNPRHKKRRYAGASCLVYGLLRQTWQLDREARYSLKIVIRRADGENGFDLDMRVVGHNLMQI
jgi:hypothetical protein